MNGCQAGIFTLCFVPHLVRFRLRITLSTLNYKVVYLREIFYPQNGDNREPCFVVSFWDFVSLAIFYTLSFRETKPVFSYMQFSSRHVKHVVACSLLVALQHYLSASRFHMFAGIGKQGSEPLF